MNWTTSKENLGRLKNLVCELSDRDAQLKQDLQLFEGFFETFPIPVTIWSISSSGTVLSRRGNGFVCEDANDLEGLFSCPKVKELSVSKHELALQGEKVDYFVRTAEQLFYVKLVPRFDNAEHICGVTGISWDVSDNMFILSCLEEIFEYTAGRRGDYKKINEKSKEGLAASRLKRLLSEFEE
jgi:hypothetical protein